MVIAEYYKMISSVKGSDFIFEEDWAERPTHRALNSSKRKDTLM